MEILVAFIVGVIVALGGKGALEKAVTPSTKKTTGPLDGLAAKADKKLDEIKKIKASVDEIDRKSSETAKALIDKFRSIFD